MRMPEALIAALKKLGLKRYVVFRWLPHGEPVPEGWEVAEDLKRPTVHSHYSVLILRRNWSFL